ncbi:type II secretion system protein [Rubellicoccus peritrichatus]|uniref:Type II secretion system protein n=1 Tax=Rubellicoccus peritrichatus TaxID=3080537 RepID=A0AAQ3LDD0_9BACT|nr:type II secretion system protein [Puniceicoccus sp. CR14]WOO43302.1 type II secretion system protein [Puniceicoccus sp. CR14]
MKTKKQTAFTLIELLTVIAIIGTLSAILIPVIGSMRHSADSSKSVSNLRQIGNAVLVYTSSHGGAFPFLNRPANNPDADSQYFWPQALEESVFGWDRATQGKHPVFVDPTALSSHGISDYGGSTYIFLDANGANPNRAENTLSVNSLEDPSRTLVVCTSYAENSGKASWYVQGDFGRGGSPVNIPEARLNQQEIGVVFADGHVELIEKSQMYDDLEYRRSIFDVIAN